VQHRQSATTAESVNNGAALKYFRHFQVFDLLGCGLSNRLEVPAAISTHDGIQRKYCLMEFDLLKVAAQWVTPLERSIWPDGF